MRPTVEKKTLESSLDLKLGVEDDEPEGHGEDIITSPPPEIVSEHVECIAVALFVLNRGKMRSGASAGSRTSENPGRGLSAHCHLLVA